MPHTLREPIATSWRRAELAGLHPESAMDHMTYVDVDLRSPLQIAAAPVLDALNEQLAGTLFCTVLVDREGRVTRRWCGDVSAQRAFESLGIDVGASMLEESLGTNALGTVLETRDRMMIVGPEHFAVALRGFSCYGHPIVHPTTRRIEGVLDVSAAVEAANPLLAPVVARAVADIEQRLLDGSRMADKQLLAAIQATGTRHRAVVAFGHDLLLANEAANDLLGPTDIALMRMLSHEVQADARVDLTLESGQSVRVEATRIGGPRGGLLLQVEPREMPQVTLVPSVTPPSGKPMLICGPSGSGRSTQARIAADGAPLTVLTAASALLDGSAEWARNFAAVVRSGQGVLCIDGLDLLSAELVDLVATHAATRSAPRLVLVCGPLETVTGRAAAIASECTDRLTLQPLIGRMHQLPELVRTMLSEFGADSSLHFTPGALRSLSAQPWPGNLRELKAVIEHVLQTRHSGAITVADLPAHYRAEEPGRPLAPIDQAERAVIVEALRESGGNKVRAAHTLGISRTTLYARMRTLRITAY